MTVPQKGEIDEVEIMFTFVPNDQQSILSINSMRPLSASWSLVNCTNVIVYVSSMFEKQCNLLIQRQ